MTRTPFLAAVLAVVPAVVLAQGPPQGVFEAETCTNQPSSDRRLSITGLQMRFWEMGCTFANPVAISGMDGGYLYDAECSGEGEDWQARYLIMAGTEGQLVLVQSRWAQVYAYCGPVPIPEAPGAGSVSK